MRRDFARPILLMVLLLVGQAITATRVVAAPTLVPVFELSGAITEKPQAEDFPFAMETSESLHSLVGRLDKAAGDEKVAAVVILLDGASIGLGQAQEIRAAMDRLREAGKTIYTHADTYTSTGGFGLMCGASHISMTPTGYLFITGIHAEQMYLRGLLDKLGVVPDFVACGAYKSASETFMRTGPSPAADEMYGWLYDGFYDSFVDLIATGRKVNTDKAKAWIDLGLISSETAKKEGMIDAVEHRDAFLARLQDQIGDRIKFDKKYGKKLPPTIDLNNPFAVMNLYMQILTGPKASKASTKDAIAIVYVEGNILDGKPSANPFGTVDGAYSDPIRRALEKAADDPRVKGVVLRVNSPGGSAVASEVMLNAAKKLSAKKPVVVSMGNVAASGGYYVACCSDTIFADPGTITGSIGVLGGKVSTTAMWEKVGVNFHANSRGKRAAMLSSSRIFTDDERAHFSDWMHEVYGVFKKHVTDVRGDRLKKPIEDLAGGRVYTGKQAQELGLVDHMGGLNEAIHFVANKAGVADYEVRPIPEPTNFLETLLGDLSGEGDKEDGGKLSLKSGVAPRTSPLWEAALPMLQGLDPERLKIVQQGFQQIELLQKEGVVLTMPLMHITQ
ncbi:MAG: signal peptide peptidase SppA [Planctomycetaceae bacterium]